MTLNNARLAELFGGRDRFRLLQALYAAPERKFSNAELAARCQVDVGNANRTLRRWAELGLVSRQVDGRNVTYQASDAPLLKGLHDIMLQADALLSDIAAALPPQAHTVAVFGSSARGEEHAGSDVDVLVLGDELSSIRINAALKPVGRTHRRDIRATVLSAREFADLVRAGDSFAQSVLAHPVVLLRGELPYAAS